MTPQAKHSLAAVPKKPPQSAKPSMSAEQRAKLSASVRRYWQRRRAATGAITNESVHTNEAPAQDFSKLSIEMLMAELRLCEQRRVRLQAALERRLADLGLERRGANYPSPANHDPEPEPVEPEPVAA